mmetsp:Transcript_11598/g.30555  ORF Transcript_11598/g.30555 Transcript_11598/m.30555 type:complete len:219 (-) Transcript_11598:47-703(-)
MPPGDGRSQVNLEAPEAMIGVWQALGKLKNDDRFHEALDCQDSRKALKHWSGECRLSSAETEEWEQNPRIMSILSDLKQLQHACAQAGMKVPLGSVLFRTDIVDFPDGSKLVEGKLVPKPDEPVRRRRAEGDGAESDLQDADEQCDVEEEDDSLPDPAKREAWKKQVAWQFAAIFIAMVVTRVALWVSPTDWEAEMLGLNLTGLIPQSSGDAGGSSGP